MKSITLLVPLLFLAVVPFPSHSIDSGSLLSAQQQFLQCLMSKSFPSNLIFTPKNRNYDAVFFSSVQNPRTLYNSAKPLLILTPTQDSHVQASVLCAKSLSFPLRIRSGGHDYEGLSYVSPLLADPFVMIDLQKMASITIDTLASTAWVQAGATLGELYYAIANKNKLAAFPAGTSQTVGIGGHIGGGGIGYLTRSYGLSIDNVLDAVMVNAAGDVLDRQAMGEDLFWAIRGGGGSGFGVILSYKLKLVQVPSTVSVFMISRNLKEGDTKLVSKYQDIAYNLDMRLFLQLIFSFVEDKTSSNKVVKATFSSFFLGQKQELISIIEKAFPELEIKETDCTEMSWIESVLYFEGYPASSPLDVLIGRKPWSNTPWLNATSFKMKSDILTKPIIEQEWNGILKFLLRENHNVMIIINPMGGMVAQVPENETSYPHRKSLYDVQYINAWHEEGKEVTQKYLDWMRKLYDFMAPYVSSNPRGAYVNYRDLDLGTNGDGNTSFAVASAWGDKYFKANFKKLAQIKTTFDPSNLFRHEQSVPLLN